MDAVYHAPEAFAPCHTFSVAPLLEPKEASDLVVAAEACGSWKIRGAYAGNLTEDMDACMLAEASPAVERHANVLSTLFRVPASALRLTDLRVVRYRVQDGISGLPLHSDGSALSFVCTLNDCAGEGGTYVRTLNRVIAPPVGHALFFCGRWVHAGVPIIGRLSAGVRYVLTGFLEVADHDGDGKFSQARMLLRAMERVVDHEKVATVAHRLCPERRCWLRREFSSASRGTGCQMGTEIGAARLCSSCKEAVPKHAVRHCCVDGDDHGAAARDECCSCATQWCEDCLMAAAAEEEARAQAEVAAEEEVAPEDEEPPIWCELLADETLPDGEIVVPGARLRKVWRLRWAFGEGGLPCTDLAALRASEHPRLVRVDLDTDERIGSRSLEAGETFDGGGSDGIVRAAVEITAPRAPGAYKVFFVLLAGPTADAPLVGGDNELFADFVVVSTS